MYIFKVGMTNPILQNKDTEVQTVKQLVQVHSVSSMSGVTGIVAQVCCNPLSRVLSIML